MRTSVLGFDQIHDQQQPLRLLAAFIRRNRLPHALIFTGVDGVGKKSTAMALAQVCNCERIRTAGGDHPNGEGPFQADAMPVACGVCRPCRWIESGNHPDVVRIAPTGAIIRIDQIRGLIDTLARKTYGRGLRVAMIAGAHAMNPEAGNALLKMLEEPPAGTILILTAPQTTDLLPTIVSRCQHLRFRPLTAATLESLLVRQEGIDAPAAAILARMAGGSYTRAVAMYEDSWIARREWIVGEISTLEAQTTVQRMALAERLAALKKNLPDALTCILHFYRDLLVWHYDPGKIINRDLEAVIARTAAGLGTDALIERIRSTQTAFRRLGGNANPRLTMETLLLQLDAA
ncbi:MAG: DNA polymerase III subunit delta' [Desulfobacterales bacterium]|nr:DNA polymerase III subunit delta' [Desulfobacterales bacterium]